MAVRRRAFSNRDIARRCEIVRWMNKMGWDAEIQDSIMMRDNPDPEKVVRLVYLHGPAEALRRIQKMISK